MSENQEQVTNILVEKFFQPQPLTWSLAVCKICRSQFDYIKQDRVPIPTICRICSP